jgi:hypothetical protein
MYISQNQKNGFRILSRPIIKRYTWALPHLSRIIIRARLYREALNAPRSLKDFDGLVNNWERSMNIIMNKEVMATESVSDWFLDLGSIELEGILPIWAESYEMNQK